MGSKYTILCFNYGKDVTTVLESYRTNDFDEFLSRLRKVIEKYDLVKTEIRHND